MNLREMFGLRVPIISVVIGEGGSGGALAIGCANRNLIMENSVYYVASPEACAAILWRSRADAALVRCSRLFWAAWCTGATGAPGPKKLQVQGQPEAGLLTMVHRRPSILAELAALRPAPVAEQGPPQGWRASWGLSCALRYSGSSTWQTPGMWPSLGSRQHWLGLGPCCSSAVCGTDGSPPPGWPLWASAAWSSVLLNVVGQVACPS